MRETEITVRGVVITEPVTRRVSEESQVTNFRLVARPRYYERRSQAWVDGEPVYLTVSCWRNLAVNVAASVVKRDRVIIAGRMRTPEYVVEGVRRSGVVIEADTVGHDLGYGTASFQWGKPRLTTEDPAREQADELSRLAALEGAPDDLDGLMGPPSKDELDERRRRAVALARASARTAGESDPDDLDPDDDLEDDDQHDEDDLPEGLNRTTGELVGSATGH